MQLNEILDMWCIDSKVDREMLGEDISRVSVLHAKYLQLFYQERVRLLAVKKKHSALYKKRWDYWAGLLLDHNELATLGWEPQALKIPKTEVPFYLESDPVIQDLKDKVDVQQYKVDALESITKAIMQRGYQLNTLLNWEKFNAGQ